MATASTPKQQKSPVTIIIKGVNPAQAANIRQRLALSTLPADSDADYVSQLFAQSTQEITEALQPFGYYHVTITSVLKQLRVNQWQASYNIHLGPPIYLRQVTLKIIGDAQHDPEFAALLQKSGLTPGSILSHPVYEQLKENLLDLANQRGYFQAKFIRHQINLDWTACTADVQLTFASGPRYVFGQVIFHQAILADDIMQRFIPFKKNAFYSAEDLLKLQNNLSNVYFSSVDIVPMPTLTPYPAVPLDITLVPGNSQNYTAGTGYGTDTGVRGTLGWEWQRVNRYGHRLSVFAQPAQYRNNIDIQYIIPGPNPLLDQYAIMAGFLNEDPSGRDLKSTTEYTHLSYQRGDPTQTWQRTLGVGLQHDRYQSEHIYEESILLLPSTTWERTRGKSDFATKSGYFLRLNLRGAGQNILSTTSFLQGQITAKYNYRLGQTTRLLFRTDLGATAKEHELTALPPSLRFYAGGDSSVRGYGYQSLGIQEVSADGTARIIGGLYLLVGSAELEQKLAGNWGIATFFDAGQASNSFSTALAQGAGIGIRWYSPLGLIRLDLAQPLNDATRNIPRIHFSFGYDI